MRVISVCAVVVGHAYPGMPGEEYLQIWRMPLFFFLAGFFFSTSRTFSDEFSVRWRTLAIPYISWFLILLGAVWAIEHSPWPFGDYVISGALAGGASTDMPFLAFWFISVLFFAALLLRLVLRLPWWVGVVVALVGLTLAELPESRMAYTLLGVGLVPACMSYMLAGHWFRRLGARVPARTPVGLGLLVLGFGGIALGAQTMNMKWSGFGTYLLSPALAVIICCGLVLIFSTVVDATLRRSERAVTAITELVRTGTLVVFAHALVLYVALRWLDLEGPLTRTLLALVLCWALGMLINRTPLSPHLTGLPARRSPRTPEPASPAARHR